MAFDYNEARDDADSIIRDDFSALAVSIVRAVASGPPDAPVLTPTPYGTFAVKVEFTWKQLQTGDVQESDQRWLVAAGPLAVLGITEVVPSDLLRIGSNDLTIVKCDPLQPTDVAIMFDLWIRA